MLCGARGLFWARPASVQTAGLGGKAPLLAAPGPKRRPVDGGYRIIAKFRNRRRGMQALSQLRTSAG